jgi:hypothetical protein
VTSPPRVKPEEKRKEREKHEKQPLYAPHEGRRKNAGLTSVRVRINESGLIVRCIVVRGSLTISMKCLGHENAERPCTMRVPHHCRAFQLESRDASRPS